MKGEFGPCFGLHQSKTLGQHVLYKLPPFHPVYPCFVLSVCLYSSHNSVNKKINSCLREYLRVSGRMTGIYVNATRRVLDYISSSGIIADDETGVWHLSSSRHLSDRVQCKSRPLVFVFRGATRGHDCKEHCGNQCHLWHALSDNVVEMEISCSNRDDNEFAVVISSVTLLHRRGSLWVCVWRSG